MPRRIFKPQPGEIHPVRWRLVGIWIALFSAGMIYGGWSIQHNQSNTNKKLLKAAIASCQSNHLLIENILLRSVNMKFEEYRRDPAKARARFLNLYLQNPIYKNNTVLLDRAMHSTLDILQFANPKNCVKEGGVIDGSQS